jgi:RNA recognition motif-containing protein
MGVSTGIADIEFSTHEECEKAINTLDNAEIKGEKLRVKYASSVRNPRRTRSAGVQRRNIRRINRVRRRGRPRSTRRIGRRGARTGASSTRKSLGGSRRRVFARTLGRRRAQKK